ncbi:winged helix-turn-helix transcriptional regulator [Candidatus Micrarchaeota archaeon]|nr:winged helix-turn-helix transcriptional regulator [Candidatus Micrarchaeota archaeon]
MFSKFFFLSLILLTLSFATIDNLSITSTVDQSGGSNILIKSSFSNSESKQIFLNLSASAESVIVKDRSGLVIEHSITRQGKNSIITATVPYDYLQFEISSNSFTMKNASRWDYDFSISASENISFLSASLSLPKGAKLKGTNGAVEATDSLIVSWSTNNFDTNHKSRMYASYELSDVEEDLTPIILLGSGFVLAILVILYLRNSKTKTQAAIPKTDFLESHSLFKTLDENDKEIVREIYRQKGKTTQSHLYLQTHIAKATLSRRINSLENRGILKKSQKGNRNLISLTDVFKQ